MMSVEHHSHQHQPQQLITTTTTTVDPAATAYPLLHLYHHAHTHPHAATKWLQIAYLRHNAGLNDVTVVWALGKFLFISCFS
jgi:hypothetical protein